MDSCNCIEPQWPADDLLMRYQYVSDFFISLAYFSIPLELIYFVKKSSIFPYRWVLVQFGAFIVLCGATHLINLWTFSSHSRTVAVVLTVAKIFTAIVSCATALMLIHIIPDLLSVKTRELFLKNKAAELDREMGLIRTREETGRHVHMLTHEIRSTLDRHTILRTTLVELGKTLDLEECTLWMPTRNGQELQLAHSLRQLEPGQITVPMYHDVVKQVFSSQRAVVIAPSSPVCMIRPRQSKHMVGDTVAVRVPLLHLTNFQGADWSDSPKRTYALMVLMLPSNSARRWHIHQLQLVEVVVDQVAVALSHAALLEESMRARNLLMEQNVVLDVARRDAETAIRARNDFLEVMNHEMRTPMHAIIALSSLLQESELSPEQRSMVDTILKSSNLLATLINDVLDVSRLEDGSLDLEMRTFNLPGALREVLKLVSPIMSLKKLKSELYLAPDLPEFVVGDEKRLMQTVLNVVGNAVKFTKEGSIFVRVTVDGSQLQGDTHLMDFETSRSDQHCYVRVEMVALLSAISDTEELNWKLEGCQKCQVLNVDLAMHVFHGWTSLCNVDLYSAQLPYSAFSNLQGWQVTDTGMGLNPQDIPSLFNKFLHADSTTTRNYGGTGLGLAICKRFINLMDGQIWVESEGLGRGTTVTFKVKLGLPEKPSQLDHHSISVPDFTANLRTNFTGVKVLVTDDNGVNRMVTRGLLMRLGCEVTVVSSGLECLQVISQPGQSFNVLLLDVCMPGMDGYEVAVRIQKKLARHERPLLVALTANTDRETRIRCLDLGMDGVILKPISLEKMRSVLTELLERGSLPS